MLEAFVETTLQKEAAVVRSLHHAQRKLLTSANFVELREDRFRFFGRDHLYIPRTAHGNEEVDVPSSDMERPDEIDNRREIVHVASRHQGIHLQQHSGAFRQSHRAEGRIERAGAAVHWMVDLRGGPVEAENHSRKAVASEHGDCVGGELRGRAHDQGRIEAPAPRVVDDLADIASFQRVPASEDQLARVKRYNLIDGPERFVAGQLIRYAPLRIFENTVTASKVACPCQLPHDDRTRIADCHGISSTVNVEWDHARQHAGHASAHTIV